MNDLLEISGDDISLLNDADLRTLVGRLCEADYRKANLSTRGIKWGGEQDASDGGLDVTIRSGFNPPQNSFIQRDNTGFQVKKPYMPRSDILKEMKPKGRLREEIRKLILEHGAYIIVSSYETITETVFNNRIKAMREAVKGEPNSEQLHLDFFDCNRLATWVRSHGNLILWVRNKIGKPLQGWQPYGNWAHTPDELQDEYLLDEELRLYGGTKYNDKLPVIDGINELRLLLSSAHASVRLLGLSGVGKTRFIQALFDERIGEHAINPNLAYYSDISDEPIPDPVSFANQLVCAQNKAILIVDNCSPKLHRSLTKSCTKSTVNLLTVEYDIQDDFPEETDVFRLEPASDDLITKLLIKRYPYLSRINVNIIVGFANGNARVAFALANTLNRGEGLSTLRDTDLFEKLFHQTHQNDDLIITAEICSLVYSFDGENTSEMSELGFLANLAGKSITSVFRDIQELKKRGLVQSRSVWRAILPQAIANRLAKQALIALPKKNMADTFFVNGSERLARSFTLRLSFLDDSPEAVDMAMDWIKPSGWLGKVKCSLNSFELSIVKNIAPIIPKEVLSFLERLASNDDDDKTNYVVDNGLRYIIIGLLQNLAYDPELFERSVRLLCKFALLESQGTNDRNSAHFSLQTLFQIIYSGTHAVSILREDIISELMNSNIPEKAGLGIRLLESTLQTSNFSISSAPNFGARPRDYGFWPKSDREICDWYEKFVDISTDVVISGSPIAEKVKEVLTNNLRGLWAIGTNRGNSLLEKLEESTMRIHNKRAWNDGWIAIKGILRYDSEKMPFESLIRLQRLEKLLRPENLLERARTYALTNRRINFILEDDYDERSDILSHIERVQKLTREIGAEVVKNLDVFTTILPDLFKADSDRLRSFGAGLADGCEDLEKIWQMLYAQFDNSSPEFRNYTVLLGFLSSCAEQNPTIHNAILDSLVEDKLLGECFPIFQLTSNIDAHGIERLHKSLDSGKGNVHNFTCLAWGRRQETIDDDNLASLLQKMNVKEGGLYVVIEILSMRFYKEKDEPIYCSSRLIDVGQKVISDFLYISERTKNDHIDYELAQIANVCLYGKGNAEAAKMIYQSVAESLQNRKISAFDHPRLLSCFAHIHPYTFLDEFIGTECEINFMGLRFDDLKNEDYPLNQIPDNILIDWCEKDPEKRYPKLVLSLQAYFQTRETEELSWNGIIYSILEKAPNVHEVLLRLQSNLYPMSWSGSYADALEKRLVLYTTLYDHLNPLVRNWAKDQYSKLQDTIKEKRGNERKRNQERFESFE